MRLLTGWIVLSICVALRAAPTPAPSTQASADGTSYGELRDEKVKPEQVPLIGTALGNPPTVLLQHRPAYAAGSTQAAEMIRSTLVAYRLPIEYPSMFYCRGTNSSLLGFDVDAGRVIAVTLYYQNDRKRPDDHALEDDRAMIKRINTHTPVAILMELPPDVRVMTIRYGPVDWYIANYPTTPQIAAAMRARTPVVGMSEAEAGATLAGFAQLESTDTGDRRIVVYGRNEVIPEHTENNQVILAQVIKHRIWQIMYLRGKVTQVAKLG